MNTPPPTDTDRRLPGFALCLGAVLIFFHLGAQGFWSDEVLVAFIADSPLGYIVSMSLNVEIHPPYYYFANKLLLALGHSEFLLRLPSALCGLLGIFLLHRLALKILDDPRMAGLAALLFAVNPFWIWIARQLRPYAAIGCLFLGVALAICPSSPPGRRAVRRLALLDLALICIHYAGILIVIAQNAVLLARTLASREYSSWRRLLGLYAVNILSLAAVLPFYLNMALIRQDPYTTSQRTLAQSAGKLFDAAGQLASFTTLDAIPAAVSLPLFGLCLLLLARRRPGVAWFAALALTPVAILLAIRYASHIYGVHISFLLPLLPLAAALPLAALARRAGVWAALALVAAYVGGFATLKGHDYYAANGHVAYWWTHGDYKGMVEALCATASADDFYSVSGVETYPAMAWYAASLGCGRQLTAPALTPSQTTARVHMVSSQAAFGNTFANTEEFLAKFKEYSPRAERLANCNVRSITMSRRAVHDAAALGRAHSFKMGPERFYAEAGAALNAMFDPEGFGSIIPTDPDKAATVIYAFDTTSLPEGAGLHFFIRGGARFAENTFSLDISNDGAQYAPAPPDLLAPDVWHVRTTAHAGAVYLRVTMHSGWAHATSITGPQEQVRLRELIVTRDDAAAAFAGCLPLSPRAGLEDFELLPDGRLALWARSATEQDFVSPDGAALALDLRLINNVPGQAVTVLLNGQAVTTSDALPPGELSLSVPLAPLQGANRLSLRFPAWNGKDQAATFAPEDTRDLAARIIGLALRSGAR